MATPSRRLTRQKEAVLGVFGSAKGPLAFPEALAMAQTQVPGLGQATLYRHLKTLLEESRLRVVTLPDGETRYELAALKHHHHFHCRVCDSVVDVDGCPLARVKEIPLPPGFRLESHEVTLFGVCGGCR